MQEIERIWTMKKVSWIVTIVMSLVLAGLAFIYLSPGYNLFLVRSESMTPAINLGDMIVTGPLNGPISGEVKPGTIVTYQHNRETITHRVQSVDGGTLITQGDAVEDPDPWPISMSDIKGVYLFKIPYVGYVTSFVQTRNGWFLTIIAPAALLVLWLAKDIVKEAFKGDESQREDKEARTIMK